MIVNPYFVVRPCSNLLLLGLFIAACSGGLDAAELDEGNVRPLPDAAEVLQQVRMRLPSTPVRVKGEVLCANRGETWTRTYLMEAELNFASRPVKTRYTLSDAFGSPVERLTVCFETGQRPAYRYEKGRPLVTMELPGLNRLIEGTDMAWGDLNLAFLWLGAAKSIHRDTARGRDCVVLDIRDDTRDGVLKVWVDERLYAPLQLEDQNASGQLRRRLRVKNIKKIGDRWMLKDLEVQSFPSQHRTLVRINEVEFSDVGATNTACVPLWKRS